MKNKRIVIDISPVQYRGTGVGKYMLQLTKQLVITDKDNSYILFYSSRRNPLRTIPGAEFFYSCENVTVREFSFPEKLLHFLWNDTHVMPFETLVGSHEVCIYSDWFTPLTKASVKLTTWHDMVFKLYPETVDPYIRSTQEKRLKFFEKNDALIAAVSRSTGNDLIKNSNIDSDRIRVIYSGVEVEKQSKETITQVKDKYGLHRPYILSVGKREPRKNLEKLIEAYGKTDMSSQLVIVGAQGWGQEVKPLPNVSFTGFVEDKELYALYQGALFFVFPSLYEGFGFPLLEAMALDCPTTCADSSSLSELGKGASLFFNPLSVDSIASALSRMMSEKKLRDQLQKKGLKRSVDFTWKNTAGEMLKLINE